MSNRFCTKIRWRKVPMHNICPGIKLMEFLNGFECSKANKELSVTMHLQYILIICKAVCYNWDIYFAILFFDLWFKTHILWVKTPLSPLKIFNKKLILSGVPHESLHQEHLQTSLTALKGNSRTLWTLERFIIAYTFCEEWHHKYPIQIHYKCIALWPFPIRVLRGHCYQSWHKLIIRS